MLSNIIQKQKMMRKVLISLIPVFLFAGYMYGLHFLILMLVVFPAGFICEAIFELRKKKKVSEAVFVTCGLYVLSLPPDLPWWIALIGIIFALVIGKEVFGGFGRNPFNPAICGRLFVYITFPAFMTGGWLSGGNFGLDAVTTATPLAALHAGEAVNIQSLLLGFRPGAMGESPIILILIAGIFLMSTRTASWIIILSTLSSAALLTFCLDITGIPQALDTVPALFSGSLLFVTVFMATDPVSAPKKPFPRVLYGIIIGAVSILIRTFSLFAEGTSFGVLVGNTFAPLLDEIAGGKKK
ncbi:MAG: RnfABCDGE type electron transport complex subunit D [Spirochaetales bacterium]|nr:RnfABCDGE type electron transport complex subunit D [Spirochaetales bacterium]